jgi:C-terminal processing protease CtpA/Prc
MEKLVKEQEKLLQRKQKELEAMDSRMKKQVRAYKQETTNAATVLRERYEREKLKRRLAEEDAEAVRAAVAREKTEMQQELEVAHDLEEIYKSELNRTRDQLNTSELLMEAKDKYESERDRLALQNMEDDVYRLKNQYEMEHLVNQAQEKLIHLKPYLGILFVSEPREGTLLQSVKTGHAAYLCGLRSRDVILAVNGHHTNNKAEFYAALFGLAPGDTFACTVHRAAEGGEKHFTVTMGSFNVPLPQVQALRRIVDHIYQPGTEQFNLNVQEARLSRHRPSSLKKGKRKKGKKKKVKKKKKASKLKTLPATREAWASVV